MKLKTLREDAHCGVQGRCRERPPQAQECAKAHALFWKNWREERKFLDETEKFKWIKRKGEVPSKKKKFIGFMKKKNRF